MDNHIPQLQCRFYETKMGLNNCSSWLPYAWTICSEVMTITHGGCKRVSTLLLTIFYMLIAKRGKNDLSHVI